MILCGDCLIEMKGIWNNSIDLILTDLPYGTTQCAWDTIIPFEKLWEQYWRILKPNGAVLLFATQPFTSLLISSQLNKFRYTWYWNKRKAANFLFMNKMPGKIVEDICVFYQKQPIYNPQKIPNPKGIEKRTLSGKSTNSNRSREHLPNMPKHGAIDGKQYESDKLLPNNILEHGYDVLEISREHKPIHPTQKPVALLEYLIKTYSNQGDTVLDSCMGSASTGIACINTNRKFIGIEKDETYFQIAKTRMEEASC